MNSTQKLRIEFSTDYYPFGQPMPERNFNEVDYRFGFNEKENDNEVYGSKGTFQDYGMRMYDTRLGRFISVDPLKAKYPWYSTFQFAGNDVIRATDVDGEEPRYCNSVIGDYKYNGKTKTATFTAYDVDLGIKFNCEKRFDYFGKGKDCDLYYNQYKGQWLQNDFETTRKPVSVLSANANNGNGKLPQPEQTAAGAAADFMAKGFIACLAAPLVLDAAPITFTTELWGTKTLVSVGTQVAVNQQVNIVGAVADAFTMPGVGSAAISSCVEYNIGIDGNTSFRMLGYKKNLTETAIDFTTNLTIGKFNQFNSKNLYGITGEKIMSETMATTPGSTLGATLNKKIKTDVPMY